MRDFLENFPTEEIKIFNEKKDYIAKTKGLFGNDEVTITDTQLIVKEGYYIERLLPNQTKELYIITDCKYNPIFHDIKDHFKLILKKETNFIVEKNDKTNVSNNYNFNGNFEKVNVNSMDNGITINISNELKSEFDKIRLEVEKISNNLEITSSLDELENSVGKKEYIEKYNAFVQSIANHITIFAPFIPFLTNLLNK